ncbi:MAG: KUP/HAK/KT family potassium transporter [Kofleriaceae bacterium]
MSEPARPDPTTSGSRDQAGHATHGTAHQATHDRKQLAWISLGALGVVYGDIGTSPLYAMKECFGMANPHRADAGDPASILGVVSLVFWSLVIVVCIKYLVFVLRADNKGEGGTLALAALVSQKLKDNKTRIAFPILLALFGTGLLYGEGLITPAISVLSAVEGLSEQNPNLSYLVIPIAVVILIGLFWVQRYGTGKIGSVFGWVMLVWFIAIGIAGIPAILAQPDVLRAVSPSYAFGFLLHHGIDGFLLLGSVVLCVTGCEALYADMGHFGKTPIRIAWSTVVMPGLLLKYFGQAALYLHTPPTLVGAGVVPGVNHPFYIGGVSHPFYGLVEGPMLIPMIILATMAAVIASQALISGAFSLTNQAVQLGFMPRVTVIHTSHKHEGQIYIPEINWFFMIACVALVLMFKTSSNLAAAYGIAVTGLMMITSYLIFLVCRRNWGWSLGPRSRSTSRSCWSTACSSRPTSSRSRPVAGSRSRSARACS